MFVLSPARVAPEFIGLRGIYATLRAHSAHRRCETALLERDFVARGKIQLVRRVATLLRVLVSLANAGAEAPARGVVSRAKMFAPLRRHSEGPVSREVEAADSGRIEMRPCPRAITSSPSPQTDNRCGESCESKECTRSPTNPARATKKTTESRNTR